MRPPKGLARWQSPCGAASHAAVFYVPDLLSLGGAGRNTTANAGATGPLDLGYANFSRVWPAGFASHIIQLLPPCCSYRFLRIVLAAWHVGIALHCSVFHVRHVLSLCNAGRLCLLHFLMFLFKLIATNPHCVLYCTP